MPRRPAPSPDRHDDYGFFGPDSVTWRVWSYPTSLTVGFQRAVVIEELDPHLIAAVDASQGIYARHAPATTAPCATSRWSPSSAAARPRGPPTSW